MQVTYRYRNTSSTVHSLRYPIIATRRNPELRSLSFQKARRRSHASHPLHAAIAAQCSLRSCCVSHLYTCIVLYRTFSFGLTCVVRVLHWCFLTGEHHLQ